MYEKPHQNPMGFKLKSPTPGVFQSQFPTPMGDGGGDPMGPPWGLGMGENPNNFSLMSPSGIFGIFPPNPIFQKHNFPIKLLRGHSSEGNF